MERVRNWAVLDSEGRKIASFEGDYEGLLEYAASLGGSYTPDPQNDLLIKDVSTGFSWDVIRAGKLAWMDSGTLVSKVIEVYIIESKMIQSPENYIHRQTTLELPRSTKAFTPGHVGASRRKESNDKVKAYAMRKAREILSRGSYEAKLWLVWTPLRHRVGRFVAKALTELTKDESFMRLYANRWTPGPVDVEMRRYSWESADVASGLTDTGYKEHHSKVTGLLSEQRMADLETAKKVAEPDRVGTDSGSDLSIDSDEDIDAKLGSYFQTDGK